MIHFHHYNLLLGYILQSCLILRYYYYKFFHLQNHHLLQSRCLLNRHRRQQLQK